MALAEYRYYSNALGKQTAAFLALPDASVPRPWRGMLLLHGLSDDHTIWQRRTSIERYVEGLPLVVAMPDGGRGFYCDAIEGYAYATALGDELPAILETTFGIEGPWGVAGLSMGGYGALRLALGRPERFAAAVSHSGALLYANYEYKDDDAWARERRRILGSQPEGGPNDLLALAQAADPRPAIRIDCGVDDFLIESNRAYHRHLDTIGYPHEYEEFPGDHNWAYWDEHVQEALAFLRRHMGI